jgi:LicD family
MFIRKSTKLTAILVCLLLIPISLDRYREEQKAFEYAKKLEACKKHITAEWQLSDIQDSDHSQVFNHSMSFPFAKNLEKLAKRDVGMLVSPSKRILAPSTGISWENVSLPKYYQELSTNGKSHKRKLNADHIDLRFYDNSSEISYLNYDIRSKNLARLVAAWSQFSLQAGVHPWINHGALIGWFWNQKLLPWDADIDVQILYSEFPKLVALNGSEYGGRYMLDVNPYHSQRLPIDGNTIDARFIDMTTGLFIDITALVMKGGRLSCKSPHYYYVDDLFPLHLTQLEGAFVFRPHRAMKILVTEYGERSMTKLLFNGYAFGKYSQVWTKMKGGFGRRDPVRNGVYST